MFHGTCKGKCHHVPPFTAKSCQTSCKVVGQAVKPLQSMILLDRQLRQYNEPPQAQSCLKSC